MAVLATFDRELGAPHREFSHAAQARVSTQTDPIPRSCEITYKLHLESNGMLIGVFL